MPSSPLPSTSPPSARQVIIVGAGVAGLACARELLDASLDIHVTVLEARQRTGGRILTHWFDGTDPEALPQTPHQQDQSAPLLTNLVPPQPKPPPSAHPALDPPSAHFTASPHADLTAEPTLDPTTDLPREPPANPSVNSTNSHRHDFHQLSKGSLSTQRYNQNGTHRLAVDIGASIMHGCGDENQLVLKRAAHDRIRAPIVAGSGFYESTEHAVWYNDNLGNRIPTERIVDVHNIFFMASRYMAAVASQSDDGTADMQAIFRCGVAYVCKHLGERSLTDVENDILQKICARSVGYCSPMASMALMQASAGMEVAGTDAHIGIPYEEDDPPFPGEVPSMTPTGIKQQAVRLDRSVMSTQRPARDTIANRRGGPGDRIVLDGYTPFLIDRLSNGVDIRLSQSVISISKAYRAAVNVSAEEAPAQENAARSARPRKRGRPSSSTNGQSSWAEDPEVATRTVLVSTRGGEIFQGDFVVVTVPLGVLKEKEESSYITFTPPLSAEKQEAIDAMGMGVHNKIVLRFNENDVFWPPHIPQLNCLDARFQFFNLHSYGKTGVLLVHVFAESGFAKDYWGLSDEGVVAEVLSVLGGMFCAPLEQDADANKPLPPTPGPVSARSRESLARARTAKLMGICESCRRPLTDSASACPHCGFVSGEEGAEAELGLDNNNNGHADKMVGVDRDPDSIDLENGVEELLMPSKQVSWDTLPAPVEYLVTRWGEDPYCLGSYSYMPCGSSWPMIDQLSAPEPRESAHPYLFFAGEHCSDLGWQCVHGAYETGIRAAKEILDCLDDGVRTSSTTVPQTVKQEKAQVGAGLSSTKAGSNAHPFWTTERERALTRALIGYSDVYGNMRDVIDEIAYAVYSFKKEPTDMGLEGVRELVTSRIQERASQNDAEANVFVKFHQMDEESSGEDYFPRPFEEVHKRARLVGLNGSKLRESYAGEIVRELTRYAKLVAENQISYRETLRKIAATIYRKDGGLMTKRCLSEYLRTQEFGNGPQKELFLEKYLGQGAKRNA